MDLFDVVAVVGGCDSGRWRHTARALLNVEDGPSLTDPRVTALRSENVRPLRPGRLKRLLARRIEVGEVGTVGSLGGLLPLRHSLARHRPREPRGPPAPLLATRHRSRGADRRP